MGDSGFDLDLRRAEEQFDVADDVEGSVVLGVLDGSTPPEEWLETVRAGNTLLLAVDGDVNSLAAGFAREVKDDGGTLMHFRGFLVVAPPEIDVNTERL